MTNVLDQFRLDGKVAIITGAGKGIGSGIADAFARAGAAVVLAARTRSDLDEVADGVRALGGRALVFPCDVTDMAQLAALVDATKSEFGAIDVLVNNAGGSNAKLFLETTVEDLEWAFRFNVSSAFELMRLCVPHMLERGGGSIINISSVSGTKATRKSVTYATAKGGLNLLTRNAAADLAPKIRVNAVLPGAIETPSLAGWLDQWGGGIREQMVQRTAMRRNGRVEDIANAVLYFASPASSWVTGKLLEVDGMAQSELIEKDIADL